MAINASQVLPAMIEIGVDLKDNSKQLLGKLANLTSEIESKADKITLNVDEKDFSSKLARIHKLLNSSLKGIDTSAFGASLAEVFSSGELSGEKLLEVITKMYDRLQLLNKLPAQSKQFLSQLSPEQLSKVVGNDGDIKAIQARLQEVLNTSFGGGAQLITEEYKKAVAEVQKYIVSLEESKRKIEELVKSGGLEDESRQQDIYRYAANYQRLGGNLKNLNIDAFDLDYIRDALSKPFEWLENDEAKMIQFIQQYDSEVGQSILKTQELAKATESVVNGTANVNTEGLNSYIVSAEEAKNKVIELDAQLQKLEQQAFNANKSGDISGANAINTQIDELGAQQIAYLSRLSSLGKIDLISDNDVADLELLIEKLIDPESFSINPVIIQSIIDYQKNIEAAAEAKKKLAESGTGGIGVGTGGGTSVGVEPKVDPAQFVGSIQSQIDASGAVVNVPVKPNEESITNFMSNIQKPYVEVEYFVTPKLADYSIEEAQMQLNDWNVNLIPVIDQDAKGKAKDELINLVAENGTPIYPYLNSDSKYQLRDELASIASTIFLDAVIDNDSLDNLKSTLRLAIAEAFKDAIAQTDFSKTPIGNFSAPNINFNIAGKNSVQANMQYGEKAREQIEIIRESYLDLFNTIKKANSNFDNTFLRTLLNNGVTDKFENYFNGIVNPKLSIGDQVNQLKQYVELLKEATGNNAKIYDFGIFDSMFDKIKQLKKEVYDVKSPEDALKNVFGNFDSTAIVDKIQELINMLKTDLPNAMREAFKIPESTQQELSNLTTQLETAKVIIKSMSDKGGMIPVSSEESIKSFVSEIDYLNQIDGIVAQVSDKVREKNQLFEVEARVVAQSVGSEISELEKLRTKILTICGEIHGLIAQAIVENFNVNGIITDAELEALRNKIQTTLSSNPFEITLKPLLGADFQNNLQNQLNSITPNLTINSNVSSNNSESRSGKSQPKINPGTVSTYKVGTNSEKDKTIFNVGYFEKLFGKMEYAENNLQKLLRKKVKQGGTLTNEDEERLKIFVSMYERLLKIKNKIEQSSTVRQNPDFQRLEYKRRRMFEARSEDRKDFMDSRYNEGNLEAARQEEAFKEGQKAEKEYVQEKKKMANEAKKQAQEEERRTKEQKALDDKWAKIERDNARKNGAYSVSTAETNKAKINYQNRLNALDMNLLTKEEMRSVGELITGSKFRKDANGNVITDSLFDQSRTKADLDNAISIVDEKLKELEDKIKQRKKEIKGVVNADGGLIGLGGQVDTNLATMIDNLRQSNVRGKSPAVNRLEEVGLELKEASDTSKSTFDIEKYLAKQKEYLEVLRLAQEEVDGIKNKYQDLLSTYDQIEKKEKGISELRKKKANGTATELELKSLEQLLKDYDELIKKVEDYRNKGIENKAKEKTRTERTTARETDIQNLIISRKDSMSKDINQALSSIPDAYANLNIVNDLKNLLREIENIQTDPDKLKKPLNEYSQIVHNALEKLKAEISNYDKVFKDIEKRGLSSESVANTMSGLKTIGDTGRIQKLNDQIAEVNRLSLDKNNPGINVGGQVYDVNTYVQAMQSLIKMFEEANNAINNHKQKVKELTGLYDEFDKKEKELYGLLNKQSKGTILSAEEEGKLVSIKTRLTEIVEEINKINKSGIKLDDRNNLMLSTSEDRRKDLSERLKTNQIDTYEKILKITQQMRSTDSSNLIKVQQLNDELKKQYNILNQIYKISTVIDPVTGQKASIYTDQQQQDIASRQQTLRTVYSQNISPNDQISKELLNGIQLKRELATASLKKDDELVKDINDKLVRQNALIQAQIPNRNALTKQQQELLNLYNNTPNNFTEQSLKDLLSSYDALYKKQREIANGGNVGELYEKNLDRIRTLIEEISKSDVSTNLEGIRDKLKEIDDLTKKNASGDLKLAGIEKVTASYQKFEKWVSRNTKAQAVYSGEIDNIRKQYDAFRNGSSATIEDVKRLEQALASLDTKAKITGNAGISVFDAWKKRLQSLTVWLSSYVSFFRVIGMVRSSITTSINVNAQMIELSKVSNTTIQQLYNTFEDYSKIAKDVGGTIQDTIKATADWSRNGFNLPDSKELANVAQIYKNVGAGVDINLANEYLISTLRGFKLEAQDALSIVDKINEVGNNFPIDQAGIGEALERSAAAFSAANTDLSESIALITAANSVVQDPARVGNMWKTVSARIRGAKAELEDMGEDTEGMVTSTSKLRDLVMSLTNVDGTGGFDIMLNETTYKSIYDIILGIGKVWDQMSDINQAALLEKLAGKTQVNALAAALSNVETLEKAYNSAQNSAGSAMSEQSRYMQGAEYHIGVFKASVEELSTTFADSEAIKFFTDLGTAGVNALTKLTKATNGFGLAISAALGIIDFKNRNYFGVNLARGLFNNSIGRFLNAQAISEIEGTSFKSAFLDKYSTRITSNMIDSTQKSGQDLLGNFYNKIKNNPTDATVSNLKNYISNLKDVDEATAKAAISAQELAVSENRATGAVVTQGQALTALKTQTDAATVAQSGLIATAKTLAKTLGSIVVYMAISYAVSTAIKMINDYINRVEIAKEKISKSNEELKTTQEKLENIKSQMKEIGKQKDIINSKSKLTITDEKELEKLKTQNDELERQQTILKANAMLEARENKRDIMKQYNSNDLTQYNYNPESDRIQNLRDATPIEAFNASMENYEVILDAYNKAKEKQLKADEAYINAKNDTERKQAQKDKEEADKEVDDYEKRLDKQEQELKDYYSNISTMRDGLAADKQLIGLGDKEQEALDELNDATDKYTNLLNKRTNVSFDVIESDKKLDQSTVKTKEEMTALSETITGLISNYQELITLTSSDSLSGSVELSDEQLKKYGDALEYVNGKLVLNAEAAKKINSDSINKQIEENTKSMRDEMRQYSENEQKIKLYTAVLGNNNEILIDGQKVNKSTIQSLREQNQAIVQNYKAYQYHNQRLRETTGAYQEWLAVRNQPTVGTALNDAQTAIDAIKEAIDSGYTGTEKYSVALDFLVPDDIDKEDEQAVTEYGKRISKYLTEGGVGINNFIQDAMKETLDDGTPLIQELEDGTYKLTGSVEEFADKMHLTQDMVRIFWQDLKDRDWEFDWGDDGITDLAEKLMGLREEYDKTMSALGDNKESELKKLTTLLFGKEHLTKDDNELDMYSQAIKDINELSNTTDPDKIIEVMNALTSKGIISEDDAKALLDYATALKKATDEYNKGVTAQNTEVLKNYNKHKQEIEDLLIAYHGLKKDELETSVVLSELSEKYGIDITNAQSSIDTIKEKIEELTGTDQIIDIYANIQARKDELNAMKIGNEADDGYLEYLNEQINGQDPLIQFYENLYGKIDDVQDKIDELTEEPKTVDVDIQLNGEEEFKNKVDELTADRDLNINVKYNDGKESPEKQEYPETGWTGNVVEDISRIVTNKIPKQYDVSSASYRQNEEEYVSSVMETVKANIANKDAANDNAKASEDSAKGMAILKTNLNNVSNNSIPRLTNGIDLFANKVNNLELKSPSVTTTSSSGNSGQYSSRAARANGTNKEQSPTTALVGELGREMVVDPHKGTWYTVGDNGSEFIDLPKDAIVYSHEQTEQLLKRGFVFSRGTMTGKSFANGNTDDSYNMRVFGNVDLNKRQKFWWDEKTPSTVLGAQAESRGVQFAYSPLLQDESGSPILLEDETVLWYLDELTAKSLNPQEILKLDREGINDNGLWIHDLVAYVGDSLEAALYISKVMHEISDRYERATGGYGKSYANGKDNDLVGELGTELVVDTQKGTWRLVGQNGSEFTDIKPTDIVYNAEETKKIFGRSYAKGKAYNPTTATGKKIVFTTDNDDNSPKIHGWGNEDSKNAKDVEKSSKDIEKSTEETSENIGEIKNAVEWLDRAVSSIERTNDRIREEAEDENNTYADRVSYYESLLASDEDMIKVHTDALKIRESEWDRWKGLMTDTFGTEQADEFITKIEMGNATLEEWRDSLNDIAPDDETAAKWLQLINDAIGGYDALQEVMEKLRDSEKKFHDDEVAQLEVELNMVRAMSDEIQSEIDAINDRIDYKNTIGALVTEEDYKELISRNDDIIDKYEEQIKLLERQRDLKDEGSEAYNSLNKQILDMESSIRKCRKEQAEWNEEILDIPIKRIESYISVLKDAATDLDNASSRRNTLTDEADPELIAKQYQNVQAQFEEYAKKHEALVDKLGRYDYGTEKFEETKNEIQNCESEMSGFIESMREYNKTLLQIPLNKIEKLNAKLTSIKEQVDEVNSEWELATNTVVATIDREIDGINELIKAKEEEAEAAIKPLQDQLDLMEKQNAARQRQLQLEQSQFNLAKAQQEKTIQVIRDGKIVWEANEEAIRDANQGLQDAQQEMIKAGIQDQIDAINEEKDTFVEAKNEEIEALEKTKERWHTLSDDIEYANDKAKTSEIFGESSESWVEKVLHQNGKNDDELYNMTKANREAMTKYSDKLGEQIDQTEYMKGMIDQYVQSFQSGEMTFEQAMAQTNKLIADSKDGLEAQEKLAASLSFGGYETLADALEKGGEDTDKQYKEFTNAFKAYFKAEAITDKDGNPIKNTVNDYENRLTGEGGFQETSSALIKQKQQEYEENQKKISSDVEKIRKHLDDDDDDDRDEWVEGKSDTGYGAHTRYNSGDHTGWVSEGFQPERYASGLENGSVGDGTNKEKFVALQALGLRKLAPDEIPAILHMGEGVINPKQMSTLLKNVETAAMNPVGLGAMNTAALPNVTISMGDLTLPNVRNGEEFAKSLQQNFTPIMNQYFSKVF